jgi:hypothetical protein
MRSKRRSGSIAGKKVPGAKETKHPAQSRHDDSTEDQIRELDYEVKQLQKVVGALVRRDLPPYPSTTNPPNPNAYRAGRWHLRDGNKYGRPPGQ